MGYETVKGSNSRFLSVPLKVLAIIPQSLKGEPHGFFKKTNQNPRNPHHHGFACEKQFQQKSMMSKMVLKHGDIK